MNDVVRTHKLTRSVKGQSIISNVNLTVKKGEVYGLLGPNGAGKTTV